jgi:hypothetical protein
MALFQILSDGSWRDSNAQFQQQLVRDPLLTPSWVFASHHANQVSQVLRQRWAAALTGPPSPEHIERSPMPSDERFRLHDRQRVAPVEELRERDYRQTK